MHLTPKQISLSLLNSIRDQIKDNGPISFRQFMSEALYAPGLGYYSAGLHKIGDQGDFVTAPEISPLFAQTMATNFELMMEPLTDSIILELGAGLGTFAFDVLSELQRLNALPKRYLILEVSADLKAVQQQKIQQLDSQTRALVEWIDAPPKQQFNGIIFANEVLDAIPVEVFKYQSSQFKRLMIDWQDQLIETWQCFPSHLNSQLSHMQLQLENGYRSEFIPELDQWMLEITQSLKQGSIIFVDYGYTKNEYYHPQRNQGTLVCHQRHQANFNPLDQPGLQDITAFVNFSLVADAAQFAQLELTGFTSQANYLLNSGIDKRLSGISDYTTYYQSATEFKKLILPNEMGEKFKVIGFSKNHSHTLPGFENNHAHLL